MRTRLDLGAERPGLRLGFTLIELLVVMTIIGIIIVFLLNAAMDGVRRAEERATQSLITKLEGGLNERLDALMQNQPTPNYAHGYLAGVFPGLAAPLNVEADKLPLMLPSALLPSGLPNPKCNTTQRAQVIATFDYIKAELPDVFFVDPAFLNTPGSVSYPINFTGLPFPGTLIATLGAYMLPLGHMIEGPRNNISGTSTNPYRWATGYGDSHFDTNTNYLVSTHPELGVTGSGIYGASYTAAAGLYKNLGYAPIGYDMIDNDGNGLVDDWLEATSNGNSAQITANIKAHTHITARAEMLYAILVEGAGPLGSVFNRDDFTDKEVKDTDGDGLPEFVDAWGQPLQFFRWPLLYHSDIQRGQAIVSASSSFNLTPPYATRTPLAQNTLEQREQDPLDTNQQLVAPGWFSTSAGALAANFASPFALAPVTPPTPELMVPAGVSLGAQFFGTFFHRLTEPFVPTSGTYFNQYGVDWDRSGAGRRAFFTKFLVLSGGPDQAPGVFLYSDAVLNSFATADIASVHLIANENNAMPFGWTQGTTTPDVDFISSATIPSGLSTINHNVLNTPSYPTTYEVIQAAQDDITNQNLQATGGIGGSG